MAVGDLPAQAKVIPSLKQAWTNMWPNFWWLLLFGVITLVATELGGAASGTPTGLGAVLSIIGALVAIFLGIPLSVGLVKVHLVASRGDKPTWGDFGYAFSSRYWSALGLNLLVGLIIVGGLILLIVPGIYWGVRMSFANQRFVQDNLGVMEAIRASRADVTGRWWSVFGLGLMAIPLIIAGFLALGVGVFVAFVLISQMSAVYWRSVDNLSKPAAPGPGAPKKAAKKSAKKGAAA